MRFVQRYLRRSQILVRTMLGAKYKPGLDELIHIYTTVLGPNGREVLLELARRMKKGAVEHGDFEPRAWNKETREEALDQAVYITVSTLYEEGRL